MVEDKSLTWNEQQQKQDSIKRGTKPNVFKSNSSCL